MLTILLTLFYYPYIRRPHKGRCSEPRRAPKCNQGRPLRDVGPAGPARSPVGHGHVINQACNVRMSTCMRRPRGLEAAVTSPRFAGLPVRVPGVTGLPFTRFQETRFLVTRNKVSSYKKQEKLVWCVVEEGPSLHTHTQ